MKTVFPSERFRSLKTPFYYYDLQLLRKTLDKLVEAHDKYGYILHYAMKANANPVILKEIRKAGLGIDCVSGNEVGFAVENGFNPSGIVYAGVGKTDDEITLALQTGIYCFNVESMPEIKAIDAIAGAMGKSARIALRINPNIDAHSHRYITTGLEENKFGIGLWELDNVLEELRGLNNIQLIGLHFHIGSQIMDNSPFRELCNRINDIQKALEQKKIKIKTINVGGGLGVDYARPDTFPIADFDSYFATFHKFLELRDGQELHFEPGRSVTAQCGSLITRVIYVKEGRRKKFAIVDAGMNDLIRPALYQAAHKIENISSELPEEKYDVVGPVCESSDCFGKEISLPGTKRGDFLAIRSAGAYGEVMAMRYNLRKLAESYFSE